MDIERIKKLENLATRYLDLHTEFKCNGTVKKDTFSKTACFAKALKTRFEVMDNTYEILIHKSEQAEDNFLYFSIEEIEEYIGYVKEVYDNFTFEITENKDTHIIIKIHINDAHVYHTFVLTCIRYLYEFRYAIILSDAIMLKRTFRFKDYNIISLMALILDSTTYGLACSDMSHFPDGYIALPISKDEYKKRLSSVAERTRKVNIGEKLPWGTCKAGEDYLFMPFMTNILPSWGHVGSYEKERVLRKLLESIKKVDINLKLYEDIHPDEFQVFVDNFPQRYRIYRENINIIWNLFEDHKEYDSKNFEDAECGAIY